MATKKSTTKSKKANKRFLNKVHTLTERDIFKSIAVASILFNILFFTALFVLISSNSFDRSLYTSVKNRYCNNIKEVENRAEKLGNDQAALMEWHVSCLSADFEPYHSEAVDKFKVNFHNKYELDYDHDH